MSKFLVLTSVLAATAFASPMAFAKGSTKMRSTAVKSAVAKEAKSERQTKGQKEAPAPKHSKRATKRQTEPKQNR